MIYDSLQSKNMIFHSYGIGMSAFGEACTRFSCTSEKPDSTHPNNQHMEVSINGGTQKLLFILENPFKMDDLRGTPSFGNLHMEMPQSSFVDGLTSQQT
jgi:hypothetical protein